MSKHKALELAGKLYENGDVPSLEECSQAASELRSMHDREQRQHALIVQMREALKACQEKGKRWHPCDAAVQKTSTALAAADQYLGEQA